MPSRHQLASRIAAIDFAPVTILTLRRRGVRLLGVVHERPGVRCYEVEVAGAVRALSYSEVVALAQPIMVAA